MISINDVVSKYVLSGSCSKNEEYISNASWNLMIVVHSKWYKMAINPRILLKLNFEPLAWNKQLLSFCLFSSTVEQSLYCLQDLRFEIFCQLFFSLCVFLYCNWRIELRFSASMLIFFLKHLFYTPHICIGTISIQVHGKTIYYL